MLFTKGKILFILILLSGFVSADLSGNYLYGYVFNSNLEPLDGALVYVYASVDSCTCASPLASVSGIDGSFVESLNNLIFIECEKYDIGQDCSKYLDSDSYFWLGIEAPDGYVNIETSEITISELDKNQVGFKVDDVVLLSKINPLPSGSSGGGAGNSGSAGSGILKIEQDNSVVNYDKVDIVDYVEEPVIAHDIKDAIVDEYYQELIDDKKGKDELDAMVSEIAIRNESPYQIFESDYSYMIIVGLLLVLLVLGILLYRIYGK